VTNTDQERLEPVAFGAFAEREIDLDLHSDRIGADIAAITPDAFDSAREDHVFVAFRPVDLDDAAGVVAGSAATGHGPTFGLSSRFSATDPQAEEAAGRKAQTGGGKTLHWHILTQGRPGFGGHRLRYLLAVIALNRGRAQRRELPKKCRFSRSSAGIAEWGMARAPESTIQVT